MISPPEPGRRQTAAAALLRAGSPPLRGLPFPWWSLLTLYVAAEQVNLGFQRRGQSVLVALAQLPLALGVVLIAPVTHLIVRLTATTMDCVVHKRSVLKTAVNLGIAGLEVGIASLVLHLLHPLSEAAPPLWGALLLGMLVAGATGYICLYVMFGILGFTRPSWRDLAEPIAFEALVTAVFVGLAVLTVAAAITDPWAVLVVLGPIGPTVGLPPSSAPPKTSTPLSRSSAPSTSSTPTRYRCWSTSASSCTPDSWSSRSPTARAGWGRVSLSSSGNRTMCAPAGSRQA